MYGGVNSLINNSSIKVYNHKNFEIQNFEIQNGNIHIRNDNFKQHRWKFTKENFETNHCFNYSFTVMCKIEISTLIKNINGEIKYTCIGCYIE